MDIGLKKCTKCKELKSLNNFSKCSRSKSGLTSECKQCRNEQKRKAKINLDISLTRKICKDCKQDKPINKFTKNRRCFDGYLHFCKDCALIREKKNIEGRIVLKIYNKICKKCGNSKTYNDFYIDTRYKDGLDIYCKKCQSDLAKIYSKNSYGTHLIKKYGLTLEKYKEMLLLQNNKCYICGQEEKLTIDHNHITEKVRKLLCKKCNTALGMVCENINILENMILYIREHNE